MARKVAWEKWWDVNEEDNGVEELDKELLNEELEMDQQSGFSADMFFIPKKVNTPFGQYEAGDPMSPANMFDCWICHTNFPICQEEYKIINEEIEGIGAFKVISKYRFFIGVEKLFDFSNIRRQIENKICNKDNNSLDFGVY
jgi:hypothetical protein|tara:strand:- start:397 stop:822 length:426 start_codon:yes stop_codon:yes gene_type:complete